MRYPSFSTADFASLALALCCFSPSHAVTFDWATVGVPGNAGEVQVFGTFGAVAGIYRIGKHEVTNAQYTEFLNAVADTDANGLYSTAMSSTTWGGITRSGSTGNYSYAVKADSIGNGPGGADGDDYTYGNKPVVYVSFFDAMRFTNWLENGQPTTGVQDSGTTEDGVYAIGSGTSEIRNPASTYFIPSDDEWFKAAYHNGDGLTEDDYWDYPTGYEATNNNLPSNDTGNSANFLDSDYTTGNSSYPLTDVGAYTQSPGSFGTFDQGGNVLEWTEAVDSSLSLRVLRGGGWKGILDSMSPIFAPPTTEDSEVGFRVASLAVSDLPGDYNNSGTVDAADYTVWLDNLGAIANLPGDTTPGSVTQDDYEVWKANFGAILATAAGESLSSATFARVPEPASATLLLLATIGLLAHRSKR